MNVAFNTILVPVDFTINTEIAIKKAMELIAPQDGVVHLFNVIPSMSPLLGADPLLPGNAWVEKANTHFADRHLSQWSQTITESYPGVHVSIHLKKAGKVQPAITQLAKKLRPELIIIGKHNYHNWFPFLNTLKPAVLAGDTGCPVLTAKLGSLHNKIKSIVYPVQTVVPDKSLEMLITLARKYRARIYLLLPENRSSPVSEPLYNSFIETYRQLKATVNTPIEHATVPGHNLAKAALQFAQSMKADLLLINPKPNGKQSVLRSHPVNDFVKGNSKLEVLAL